MIVGAVHFDLADLVIVGIVGAAVLRGLRTGAMIQIFSYAGFWLGLGLGAMLSPSVVSLFHTALATALASILTVLGMASLLGAVGGAIGARAGGVMRRLHLRSLNSGGGAVIGAVSSLLFVWLLAGLVAFVPIAAVTSQIRNSAVITTLNNRLPPLPSFWARVQKFTSGTGFPQVFARVDPAVAPPVAEASPAQVAVAVAKDGPSMVKVEGVGCGDIQEGSGFVVAPGYVVTNAHVVAGVAHPFVKDRQGIKFAASAIEFDPRFDLAVLHVPGLTEPSLTIDPATLSSPLPATVLGYPGGGPFKAVPAGVRAHFEAVGRDIYGQGLTVRSVYELSAVVIPGNSGGPLVAANGEVIGVVFSRSVSNPDVGYALASPGVLQRVQAALSHPQVTGTGACVG